MSRKKKRIRTRDYNMVNIINGATKSGAHKDRKKEANKKIARQKVETEKLCLQCFFPLEGDEENLGDFCSKSCRDYYKEQQGEEDDDEDY